MTTAFTARVRLYSSNTPSGNATTSTSHGARRRTKSTVGEKNRDCRRQRGDEPSDDEVGVPRASPRRRSRARSSARAPRPSVTSTPCSSRAACASSSDASTARGDVRRQLALEREAPRHADDGDRLDLGAALLRERDRRRDHLLADVPELHRHEDPAELRAGRELVDGPTCSSRPSPPRAADGDEDDEPDSEPRRAGVARAWCVTSASTQTTNVSGAPTSAGSGTRDAADRDVRARAERPRAGPARASAAGSPRAARP